MGIALEQAHHRHRPADLNTDSVRVGAVEGAKSHRRNISTPTTNAFSDACRWSDVIPPESGLTFAVVWDEEEGLIAFSGAEVQDTLGCNGDLDSPIDVCDDRSTIGHSTVPLSDGATTLNFLRDNHEFLFPTQAQTPVHDRFRPVRRTQTSSTLGGFDVYARGSMLGRTYPRHRRYSCLDDLGGDFRFDPTTSFANLWRLWYQSQEKEGDDDDSSSAEWPSRSSSVNPEENLCSAFSTTTTSTSNYVTVNASDSYEIETTGWSTLEHPSTPGFSRLMFDQTTHRSSRRLRKRRPSEAPLPPALVLQREGYNHDHEPQSPGGSPDTASPTKRFGLPHLAKSVRRWTKSSEYEPWVLLEIAQEITQQYVF